MDIHKAAKEILKHVGGKENVKDVTHCFTRLRFVLEDESKADRQIVEHIEGVIQVVVSGGQFQVVLGSKAAEVYEALLPMVDLNASSDDGKNAAGGNPLDTILQTVSKVFTPLIPAIAASGLIKGILTAARLLAERRGIEISDNDSYVLFFAASQVIFYFMPVFLGYTAAKALKCNEIVAMSIGGFLCCPQVETMIQDIDTAAYILGMPVIKGAWTIGDATRVFSYTESVIPILLAVYVLAYLEKFMKRIIPQIMQIILVPGLSMIIMVPLALSCLGPIGIWAGNGIQAAYYVLMNLNTVIGGAVVGGLWGVFVIFGAHRALLPVGLNDVAVSGKQNLLAFAGAANFAQGGAALGVMLKSKNTEQKSVAASAVISAALVGITEPAIYGCNLRLKKPMVCAVVCGAIGGGIMGLGNVYGDSFANNGVLTIFTYAAFGRKAFLFYLAGCMAAFAGSAVLTYIVGFEELLDKQQGLYLTGQNRQYCESERETEKITAEAAYGGWEITSPVAGKAIALSQVSDEVFASEMLGKGIAVVPSKGEVVAPADCTVTMVYPTLHAVGLTLGNGVELLVHVGINTVELKGKYFEKHVGTGEIIKKGTKIVSFDIEKIRKAGYDTAVPIIVGNTEDYKEVRGIEAEHADADTAVICVVEKM